MQSQLARNDPVVRPLRTDVGHSILLFLAGACISFVVGVVVARAFGPEAKGLLAVVNTVLAYGSVLAGLSIDAAIVHFGARGRAPFDELYGAGIASAIALGVPVTVLAVAAFPVFVSSEALATSLPIRACLIAIPAYIALSNLGGLFRARGRNLEAAAIVPLGAALTLIAVIVSWALHGDATQLVVMSTIASVAAYAVAQAFASIRLRWGRPAMTMRSVRELARYGGATHLGSILQTANYRLDLLLVAALGGVRQAGIYSVSIAVTEVLWLVPTVVSAIVGQRAASLSDDKSLPLTLAVSRVSNLAMIATCILMVPVLLFGIPMAFGASFRSAGGAAILLLPGTVALSMWKVLVGDLVGRGHPSSKSLTAGAGILVAVPLDLVLIPRFGVPGAAVASSLAYSVCAASSLVMFSRATGAAWHEAVLTRPADLVAVRGQIAATLERFTP